MLKENRALLDLRKSVGFIAIPAELLSQLVCYLNNARAAKDKNIVGILERLLDLEKVEAAKIDGPLNELNRDLRRYQFRPLVTPWYDANWHATRWVLHWYSGRPGRKPMATFGALDMIVDLARAGHLSRLRRCNHCRKWLYAKFRHQVFCSQQCQQNNYTETEAFKAHRREYMSRRYHEQFPPRGSKKKD
jgi:hypothetical protein